MKERPILFSGPMVRAILDGKKTQTRRMIPEKLLDKYYDYDDWCNSVMPRDISYTRSYEKEYFLERCPYGVPGDRLWVREAFAMNIPGCQRGVSYRADHQDPRGDGPANPIVVPEAFQEVMFA